MSTVKQHKEDVSGPYTTPDEKFSRLFVRTLCGKTDLHYLQRVVGRARCTADDYVTFLITKSLDPFWFLLITVCGWVNQRQLRLIDYLREENRVLRQQDQRRLRFNADQRRRLAARAKGLGTRLCESWLRLSRTETLLAWYRR